MTRYSLSPLVEALNLETGASVSRALGISGKSLTDYTVLGMDERTADRLAARAGFVAWQVWPEILADAIAELEVECEAGDCTERFVPPVTRWGQKHQRFHSPGCQRRWNRKVKWATDGEARARRLERNRRYQAEVAAIRARRAERSAA